MCYADSQQAIKLAWLEPPDAHFLSNHYYYYSYSINLEGM
jgi:hypothetical protein